MLKTHEKAGLESKLPLYDDGRLIVEEGHLALKDEKKFSTREHLAPYRFQEVDLLKRDESWMRQEFCTYP